MRPLGMLPKNMQPVENLLGMQSGDLEALLGPADDDEALEHEDPEDMLIDEMAIVLHRGKFVFTIGETEDPKMAAKIILLEFREYTCKLKNLCRGIAVENLYEPVRNAHEKYVEGSITVEVYVGESPSAVAADLMGRFKENLADVVAMHQQSTVIDALPAVPQKIQQKGPVRMVSNDKDPLGEALCMF